MNPAKQRLQQAYERGELSRAEYKDALRVFWNARTRATVADLGAAVTELVGEFVVSPDIQAALERVC